jgi:nucleolar protein 56
MVTHVLFETASGYAIFKAKFHEDIGAKTRAMQESIADFSKFSKMVDLVSFSPFKSAAQALENANDVSEGEMPPFGSLSIIWLMISRHCK